MGISVYVTLFVESRESGNCLHFRKAEIVVSPWSSTASKSPVEFYMQIVQISPGIKNNPIHWMGLFFMAEKEGFEPSIPFWGIHDFQSCALGQLRDFSIHKLSEPAQV